MVKLLPPNAKLPLVPVIAFAAPIFNVPVELKLPLTFAPVEMFKPSAVAVNCVSFAFDAAPSLILIPPEFLNVFSPVHVLFAANNPLL